MITTKSRQLTVLSSLIFVTQSTSFLLHFCYMKQSILCYSIWIVVQVIRELWSREGFLTSCWGYVTCGLSSNLTSEDLWFGSSARWNPGTRESNLGILPLWGWWDNMMEYMQKSEYVEKKIEIHFRSSLFYVIMSIKFFLNCSVKRVCWRLTLTISL